MELRYKRGSLDEFEAYLRWYEDVFCDLFSDTGLRDELKIIQEHRDRAAHLKVEIIRAVHDHVVEEPVLGRKKKGKFYELCFYAGHRLVVVCYSDDRKSNIRWIESILLGQKRRDESL
ncbi:hypothetical protein A3D71_00195 [Candidatus Kaiserbacteria bacterium RIFCSPHIGHO2_02_FULL_55_20]|uniref:Addiction module toxin RelE n=1 Tax=Candidatus Kaiserbacteria bacterium RIFCSPHIGHO2_02_FULL_55_20 TaxID=1798497 RepID=A0A1F6DYC8_9BACT|nr:MAG: hypothetical protein A3D71_00195 [Candidatus Kaiserbacteria bacterium RIFCSPHIGHO2_02_FULL_55_20]